MCKSRGSWAGYNGGDAPGLSLTCAEWIYRKEIAGYATDTWGTEVIPNETPDVFQPIHCVSLVHTGVLVGEIFDLDGLAEENLQALSSLAAERRKAIAYENGLAAFGIALPTHMRAAQAT